MRLSNSLNQNGSPKTHAAGAATDQRPRHAGAELSGRFPGGAAGCSSAGSSARTVRTVSYTHLTLPTNREV